MSIISRNFTFFETKNVICKKNNWRPETILQKRGETEKPYE
jgi:hypothetical protein